jgi:hypothetical protein
VGPQYGISHVTLAPLQFRSGSYISRKFVYPCHRVKSSYKTHSELSPLINILIKRNTVCVPLKDILNPCRIEALAINIHWIVHALSAESLFIMPLWSTSETMRTDGYQARWYTSTSATCGLPWWWWHGTYPKQVFSLRLTSPRARENFSELTQRQTTL